MATSKEASDMVQEAQNPQAPALTLFPLFRGYKEMVSTELEGLTDAQLDWKSTRWGWSEWSIRNNVSHVASHLFRWYILRWGDQLFPSGPPFSNEEVHLLAGLPHRQLDHERWGGTEQILEKLGQALKMVEGILAKETVLSVNQKTIKLGNAGFYGRIADRYPGTLRQDPKNPSIWLLTLEGNLRHSEGEMVTHLYNVQRLKRAQKLKARVTLPSIGYWTLPDWDRSEP